MWLPRAPGQAPRLGWIDAGHVIPRERVPSDQEGTAVLYLGAEWAVRRLPRFRRILHLAPDFPPGPARAA